MSATGMRVAVVGAGIAGLTFAAALIEAGIQCQIYERAPELGEVGAGIQLSPNGTRLLHRLGAGAGLAARAVQPAAIEMRRWDSGGLLMRTALGQACADMFAGPYYCLHRADLHAILAALLPADAVRLGTRCVAVTDTGSEAAIEFADGSVVTADVVVGADGIHSVVRQALIDDRPRFSGQAVYRGLIPAGRLPGLLGEPRVQLWLGPGQHCVCYPIAAGKMVSFVATTPAGDWRGESWTEEGKAADVIKAYQGWNDDVRALLDAAGAVTRWALHDRALLSRWSRQRITIAGDAAHPMLPFGAQGANQAIEDAATLAACLAGATPAGVPAALRRYEEIRRPRIEHVQRTIQENARNHHFADGEGQRARDLAMDENWCLRSQAWLFGYDALEEVAR